MVPSERMSANKNLLKLICLVFLLTVFLVSCQPNLPEPIYKPTSTPRPEATKIPPEATQEPIVDPLLICLGEEPTSLYPYGDNSSAALAIRAAIFDGPMDNLSYEFHPVLLEKIPSLADGDASIKPVTVSEGDLVLSENRPLLLEAGMRIRPAGCNAEECEIIYQDGELEMDQLEVHFSLLPDLLWSDGTPLSTADSIYAFEIANHPDTPISKSKLKRTASYIAIDEQTVVWVGIPGFLDPDYATNFWAPMPEHLWGKLTAAELLSSEISSRSPIGWGAYLIEEWIPGQSIRLSANPNYFRANEGLPRIESILYRFIGKDGDENINALLKGECDILASSPELYERANDLLDLQEEGELFTSFASGRSWEVLDIGIHPSAYDDGYSLYYGDRPDFFSDPLTRQAIASCIDRQMIVDTQLYGQSIVLDSYLPPQHPLFNQNIVRYPYDPQNGIALLEQAGWIMGENNVRISSGIENISDGTVFEISFWTTSGNLNHRLKAGEKIAANLSACGIKVNLEIYSPEELYAKAPEGPLFGRNFDLVQYPWQIGQRPSCDLYLSNGIAGDPFSLVYQVPWLTKALPNADLFSEAFPWAWGGWNTPGYANQDYDEACSAALASLPGMPTYDRNHLLAQKIFSEDLPVIPLYLSLEVAAVRSDICNFELDPTVITEFWNIEDIGYGEYCFSD